ncbi:ATP-dependent acyl-CoA ligase [Saccharomonospora xinjiangensis]|uniref:Acyl-CoA synthetase (AMP-forming)/AMP-acid ligase II n=1 Tax=Saccharomonospora xinjiangensis XJ-54 TaxID=882086 RepID=I0V4D1_9PSEU|nr:ATP-dependent acyl-CoA ligase [Saccharomonospora xinjiangensis]EID54984.1 acyl-CoA synthetase (AMP-forming)/AMP-acid ligase II [Saccharomonospora xinjiangensis XJ-54]
MSDDLVGLLRHAATAWPDKDALVFDATGERLTFADVADRVETLAGSLHALGVRRSDRVAVMLDNRPEFPLLWLALARLGAVLVPVNTNYRELDGEHVLAHSGARFAVAGEQFAELLRTIAPKTSVERVLTPAELPEGSEPPPYEPAPELPTNIQYTSGTTGAPKGCVLPHSYWTTLAGGLVSHFPNIGADDMILTAQPFHYIDPQWNVALGLASGATLVVLDRFHPSTFWEKVREYGVTWFYCLGLMPTLLLRMPPSDADRHHKVRAVSASAIPKNLHADLERRWGAPWFEAFGMTETGGDIRMYPGDHDDTVGTGCLGRPAPCREVMIADDLGRPVPRGQDGELLVRGVGLMHGYHDDPEATAAAFRGGWFRTGDIARMDEQGLVYYVGRTKDMIRRSGENIVADEVERALALHPAVRTAAVLGVRDDLRGEEVKALVVLTEGHDITPDELAEHCGTKLAYFKVPRYWAFVDSLPLTASERIAKGELRKAGADTPEGSYDRVEQRWR